jgi:hypothetical protein
MFAKSAGRMRVALTSASRLRRRRLSAAHRTISLCVSSMLVLLLSDSRFDGGSEPDFRRSALHILVKMGSRIRHSGSRSLATTDYARYDVVIGLSLKRG